MRPTRVGHGAAVARHRDPHLAGGAIAVVGQALDQDRYAVGRVTLVGDGLPVGAAGLFPGPAFTGLFDVVVGYRTLFRLLDGVVESRVARRVTAADARRPRCS